MELITASEAAALITNGATLVSGGFGSCGHPDVLTKALRDSFLRTGMPSNLTLLFAAGQGDKAGKGLDQLALDGLVKKAIGGFWGLCPALAKMAVEGRIEAHNWPQGAISKLFSRIAAGEPGLITKIGLGTFVDPAIEGGVIGASGADPIVEPISIKGEDYLLYPSMKVDYALLRGSVSDECGNISFESETSFMDAMAQAQAVKNCGGKVIVQVKKITASGNLKPAEVKVPSFLVDFVVLADDAEHPQTYGRHYEAAYTSRTGNAPPVALDEVAMAKRVIASRAARELANYPGANINLGIGIPAIVGAYAKKIGVADFTLTVESGVVGGVPDEGLSFGASLNPQAIVEQAALFDFYDGGGLDVSFLGFGEVDRFGNVNVSKFGERLPGAGGFINISQTAKNIYFCGTATTRGNTLSVDAAGRVTNVTQGKISKFVNEVGQLTFNADTALRRGQQVHYITEFGLFKLTESGIELVEIVAGVGIDIIRDVVPFHFDVAIDLKEVVCVI
ncbi:acyl CoA:acetate/3-ketoacid CoA transferase [Pseudomonas fontis]|uniref:Acetate CoA-transferase YdiF n=1 Tax=Pseudomonas fontis TaxID=2942633 RepID=A0ABT5NNQ4_9PSED|nr:CoA-transferase [Pseudomonas fontis]MDD0973038.1 acyl CoA:acetate/3-ketoacid CoA transferase [Pseudomonas fontis]MDD0989807.1 acyl CoA:acetate/3-ketoacid CoA transferase [Pseudomonas fontis]